MDGPEQQAEALLAELPPFVWDGGSLPVPVEAIADSHCGLLVRDVAPERMPLVPGAPALAEGESLSGLLIPADGEIWVNADEAAQWPGRRRFTIGHELGHWRLHRPAGSLFCRTTEVRLAEPGLPDIEDEASRFAAAVMFPAGLVREHHRRTGGDLQALRELFGASGRAMRRAVCGAVRRPQVAAAADVELFFEDDAAYEAWRASHRVDGFVLNDDLGDGSDARLHRAGCSYLDMPVRDEQPRTRDPKLCATEPASLRDLVPGARACGRCRPGR